MRLTHLIANPNVAIHRCMGLFAKWAQPMIGLAITLALLVLLFELIQWGLIYAEFQPNLAQCFAIQEQTNSGACWGVIAEKWKILLLGRYPPEATLQGLLGLCLLVAAWLLTIAGLRLGAVGTRVKSALIVLGMAVLGLIGALFVLSGPKALGLEPVPTHLWGGLPLTFILALLTFAMAFPLGLMLALGRHKGGRILRGLCTGYIELIRSIPLVCVLFLAAFVLPKWWNVDIPLLLRVLGLMSLFVAAYVAEVIRGGLQGVPAQQSQAAMALGLSPTATLMHVLLPQALRYAAPGLANVFVGVFKECSLVAVVGLFELTGSIGLALNGDVNWRAFFTEAYVFAALIYIVFGFAASKAIPAQRSNSG